MSSRFGRQPVADALARKGLSIADTAMAVGLRYSTVRGHVMGDAFPRADVCQALSDLIGEPVDALFTKEALAAVPAKSGPKPKVLS